MTGILFGFSQAKALKYNFGLNELAVLRWLTDWYTQYGASLADMQEGDKPKYESDKMEFITHESGERYYWVDLNYAYKQLPILGVSTKTFAEVFGRLSGEFPKGSKVQAAKMQYPLKKYLSSKSGCRRMYYRLTSAIQDLTTAEDTNIQAGLDNWTKPKKVPTLMEDKVALSDSFIKLYNQITEIHNFKHKLPEDDAAPSKVLLQAQTYVNQILGGTFATSNKFDKMQDVSGFEATKDAIIRAVERYHNLTKSSMTQYKYTLSSFFFNPMNGKSMFLSMLMADRYPKKVEPISRHIITPRADKLLNTIEKEELFNVDDKAVHLAAQLDQWFAESWHDIQLVNKDASQQLGGWTDFAEALLDWIRSWGTKANSNHLSTNNKIWTLFVDKMQDTNGWNLEPTRKQIKAAAKRYEAQADSDKQRDEFVRKQEEKQKRKALCEELGEQFVDDPVGLIKISRKDYEFQLNAGLIDSWQEDRYEIID